jgi:Flp pilus assembly protein TadG
MRVTPPRVTMSARQRVDLHDEHGATVVIVVLSLVAMFAMMVLTVDVGGLLYKRRSMVNSADAAALAAAQACATTSDGEVPESVADSFAVDNTSGLLAENGGVADQAGCDSGGPGYVTVRYSVPQDLFFANVLGLGDSATVGTEATAAWGAIGGHDGPIPIVLYLSAFQGDCDIPDVEEGQTCYLWYDNDRFSGSAFGFMNFERWDVSAGASCPNSGGADRRDWIEGNWAGGTLDVNYPAPTYVCRDGGLASSNWATLETRVGDELVFPINDQDTTIYGGGGQVDKYNIIGFATMQLNDVLTVGEAGGDDGHCDFRAEMPAASPLNLDAGGVADGCFSAAPDNLTGLSVSGSGVQPSDWSYDPLSRTITWLGTNSPNARIEFDWSNDGICGEAPGNASARCIVVEWVGARFGGSNPGGGGDFGTSAIRLCDRDIAGSCPPGTP